MKFVSLLKKEIKELMTFQIVFALIITVVGFYILGDFMGGISEDMEKSSTMVTICNQDDSEFTKAVIAEIDKDNDVKFVTIESNDYVAELDRLGEKNLIIIPAGFSKTVLEDKKIADIKYISTMTTLAMSGNASSSGSQMGLEIIKSAVKSTLMLEKFNTSEVILINEPVKVVETTIVGGNSSQINASTLSGFASAQGVFVPIIIFILLIYSSQMIISAISTEKIDKTLETLLSAPVSRMSVLSAKMIAAGAISALNAVVYMFGFSKFMNGATGGELNADKATADAIASLGLKLQGFDYVLLGCQMFLTLLIALSISLILGALAKDVRSAQTLILPIMFMAMIPYMLTMFVDISTLSPVVRGLIYAIPFTHTFTAIDNIIFGKDAIFWGGMIYQFLFLAVCMFFAVRVFMTDKIFTISLSFGQKGFKNKKGILSKILTKK